MTMDPKRDAMDRALAASRLQKAWIAGDRASGLDALRELYAPGLRAVLNLGDESARRALRTTLEVATSAVLQFWFGESAAGAWRELLLEGPNGLAVPGLAGNAALLRLAGSAVVDTPGSALDPALFAQAPLDRQARSLAHVCLLTDANSPIDYAGLHQACAPELRGFLASWLLASYLASPEHQLDASALENQRIARDAFARVHGCDAPPIGAQIGFTSLAYRAALDESSPRAFVEALDRSVIGPALAAAGFAPNGSSSHGADVAVMLEAAGAGGKIDRRTGRVTESLRGAGARGVIASEDVERSYKNLPDGWRSESTDVLGLPAASSFQGLAASAAAIRAENLDALVYPHVSLGIANRWLAGQRLARVQISLGADGMTSGSSQMDYIVVGEDLVGDGSEFSEQVITVPGLGLDITAPPTPREPRERALDAEQVLLMSTATHDKLCGPVLDAWNEILKRSGGRAILHFFPSVDDSSAHRIEPHLAAHFEEGSDALLVPFIDRQELTDLLVEGDLYLDTYPYGGLGALVEALCAGMPVVTIEGDCARNRVGAAILRRLGLPEGLIAKSLAEYVEVASALVADASLRIQLRANLTRERVLAALIDPELPRNVGDAIALARQLGPRQSAPGAPLRCADAAAAAQAPRLAS
ncbi:hypothetical protein Pla86_06060 [Planctomycetes bacterium Pla86]|uniref:O-GlcNAc transferase C-terminal domain-containing protein n=2 Tax=Engelhardtia mirabilis TaxID=2528011 RepID=A0A518BEY6_9BACT|nr:hypothetical protein Pla133_06060 [Planctomycetes bacterium Pla133]QDU99867.1 hypothetical protein Pla86_06060 [Planctomycetes bacterium Pla86]